MTLASGAVVVAVLLAVVVVVVADVDVVDPLVVAIPQKSFLTKMWIADLCRAGMDSRETDGVDKFFFTCVSCEAHHSSSNIVFKL